MKITHLFFLLFKGDRYIDISNPEDYNVLRRCFNWVVFFLEMEIVQLYRPC